MITRVRPKKSPIGLHQETATAYSPSEATTGGAQFKTFAILWAVAALFHMAHSSVFDAQLNLALLTLAAFLVIFRPSLGAFVALILLQVFDAVFRMPITTNHWIFTAFVNLTIIQVLVFTIVRNQSFKIETDLFLKRFSAIVRVEVIILYFFAVFHKLNAGFFTPATSCASDLLKAQHIDHIVPLSDTLLFINAYLTIIIEAAIPLLLCFKRTRHAGVIVGLIFHCILSYSSYNAFYDFSSLMFACYFLFISPAFAQFLVRLYHNSISSVKNYFESFASLKVMLGAASSMAILVIVYLLNRKLNNYSSVHLYFFWTVYSVAFTAAFLFFLSTINAAKTKDVQHRETLHWSFYIFPIVVFVNGTMPYLGLKTENSYAMFSNLRTEGGTTNHFIVPVATQIFNYQQEVVEIISSTDPVLQRLAEERQALVLFEFRNYVNDVRPERIDFRLNGQQQQFTNNDKSALASVGKNPYVLRKLMKFRPFALDGPQPCRH